jgi:hypothetical protein
LDAGPAQLFSGRRSEAPGFGASDAHTATVEDLRRYQLYLVDHGISRITLTSE